MQLEVPLHILLVTFQAMKRSGRTWPMICDAVQEMCLQRLTARARINEGLRLTCARSCQAVRDEHPERYLLAFAYAYLGDHDLLSVPTDAEKFLLLASINLGGLRRLRRTRNLVGCLRSAAIVKWNGCALTLLPRRGANDTRTRAQCAPMRRRQKCALHLIFVARQSGFPMCVQHAIAS